MRYQVPPSSLFELNRKKFIARMQGDSLALFFANDLIPVNSDEHYRFRQDSNFYYLTGIDQEDCILLLFPNAPKPELREILFIKKTNATIQVWEGWKYSIEEAKQASGISTIKYIEDFNDVFLHLINHVDLIYLDFNEHDRNRLFRTTAAHRFAYRLQNEFPGHKILRSNHILMELRMIKSEEEVEQIKRAINITEKAFRRVLKFIKPGVIEYEIEAEILHEFIRNGSSGAAYESIIASGKNACILHYNMNNQVCKDGDLVLMDFGAKYGNYSSDLTRTVPVNGKFTERQKEVYNAVLRVHNAAKQLLKPAQYCQEEYQLMVMDVMTEELIKLKLLTKEEVQNQKPEQPACKKYFMHGTSHHLGLDTHDLGSRYVPFQSGMIFTCEPGIYIPEEGIGIRIENNILITNQGPVDLMESIPIKAEEIEELMRT